MGDMISILIASRNEDDQEHILAILSGQDNFNITGTVKDETGAIIKAEFLKPDIIILDLQLSETTGLDLVRIIRRRSPASAIIIFYDKDKKESITRTYAADQIEYQKKEFNQYAVNMAFIMSHAEVYAILSIMAGISGFLVKESDIDKLAYIIKIIYMGGCYINMSITVRIFNAITSIKQFPRKTAHIVFSQAERNIIKLLAKGFSNAKIAKVLNYSMGSIKNSITKIRHKVQIKGRTEIAVYSLMSGLIGWEQLI